MRSFFYGLGILAAAAFVAALAGFGYLFYLGSHLDTESKSYAISAVHVITSQWSSKELMNRASPELAASLTGEQATSVFKWFGVLGPLVKLEDCKGDSPVYVSLDQQGSTTAHYNCSVKYEQGSAVVHLALVKVKESWFINAFNVGSDYLMSHKLP